MDHVPKLMARGRYLLFESIADTGRATVFRAWDTGAEMWRAVKLLAPEYAEQPDRRTPYEVEVKALSDLKHPALVQTFDVGVDRGRVYVVTELLEYGSLREWVEMYGAMPPKLAVHLMLDVCEAIEVAHTAGYLHTDLNPSNILITTDGLVRVSDFGISLLYNSKTVDVTQPEESRGRFGYLAPEQRVPPHEATVVSDIYALGASLFFLVTGRHPGDLYAAEEAPEVLEEVPHALHDILMRATRFNPRHRFPQVGPMVDELRALLKELPEIPIDTPPLVLRAPQRRDPSSHPRFRGRHLSEATTMPDVTPTGADRRIQPPPLTWQRLAAVALVAFVASLTGVGVAIWLFLPQLPERSTVEVPQPADTEVSVVSRVSAEEDALREASEARERRAAKARKERSEDALPPPVIPVEDDGVVDPLEAARMRLDPTENGFGVFTSRPGPVELSRSQVRKLLTGRSATWPDGSPVTAVVLPTGDREAMAWLAQESGLAEHNMVLGLRDADEVDFVEVRWTDDVAREVEARPGSVGLMRRFERPDGTAELGW